MKLKTRWMLFWSVIGLALVTGIFSVIKVITQKSYTDDWKSWTDKQSAAIKDTYKDNSILYGIIMAIVAFVIVAGLMYVIYKKITSDDSGSWPYLVMLGLFIIGLIITIINVSKTFNNELHGIKVHSDKWDALVAADKTSATNEITKLWNDIKSTQLIILIIPIVTGVIEMVLVGIMLITKDKNKNAIE